jgi:hypothetical protein
VRGCRTKSKIEAWLGAGSHPSGKASPVKKIWTGYRTAATVPPTLNKVHKRGVIPRLIYPRKIIQATTTEAISHTR